MKLSVIFGVLHMIHGICTAGGNAIYFKQWATFFTEVITGLVILIGLFGWMDFLIFAKWFFPVNIEDTTLISSDELEDRLQQDEEVKSIETKGDYDNEHMPSIISVMVGTIFGFGKPSEKDVEAGYYSYVGGDL